MMVIQSQFSNQNSKSFTDIKREYEKTMNKDELVDFIKAINLKIKIELNSKNLIVDLCNLNNITKSILQETEGSVISQQHLYLVEIAKILYAIIKIPKPIDTLQRIEIKHVVPEKYEFILTELKTLDLENLEKKFSNILKNCFTSSLPNLIDKKSFTFWAVNTVEPAVMAQENPPYFSPK